MIKAHPTVKDPEYPEDTVYDYASLESLREFQELAGPADLIFAYDTNSGEEELVHGEEVLRAILESQSGRYLCTQRFALDFRTDSFEHLCAAISVTKGHPNGALSSSVGKTVRVYDSNTKRVSFIPAAELAPGMIQVHVEGIGNVWTVAATPKSQPPHRHPPFAEEIRQRIRVIKDSLDEVCPKTQAAWEDGFRRDMHPEREIASWLRIASVYKQCAALARLTFGQRREYLHLILLCSTCPREHVMQVVQFSTISRDDAERAIDLFYSLRN